MSKPGIAFIVPYRFYTPDKFYEIQILDRFFKVKPQPLPPLPIGQGPQVQGHNIEFSHDIFGYAGRTLFHVVLDEDFNVFTDTGRQEFVDKEKVFIDSAIMVVNRFIEIYRNYDFNGLGEQSFHAIPIVKTDIYDIRITPIEDDLSIKSDLVVRMLRFGDTGFGGATSRPEQSISRIESHLKQGTPIPVWVELLTSAKNYLWRGQYRLTVIEANTAFEVFVSDRIQLEKDLFAKLVFLESELNKKLEEKRLPMINWFLSSKDGWRSLANPELLNWYKKCYLLRNKAIHEGYLGTKQESLEAYEAARVAIVYIDSILK